MVFVVISASPNHIERKCNIAGDIGKKSRCHLNANCSASRSCRRPPGDEIYYVLCCFG